MVVVLIKKISSAPATAPAKNDSNSSANRRLARSSNSSEALRRWLFATLRRSFSSL